VSSFEKQASQNSQHTCILLLLGAPAPRQQPAQDAKQRKRVEEKATEDSAGTSVKKRYTSPLSQSSDKVDTSADRLFGDM